MKIIKPKKYKDMYVALENGEPLYAFVSDKKVIDRVYMLSDNCNVITLPEFPIANKDVNYSGDIMLGENAIKGDKINLAITKSNATIKIPFNAFENSTVNLFMPKDTALYYVMRKNIASKDRQIFTSYLLVAPKGLTTSKGYDTEYHLTELENNKRVHSLKTGNIKMNFTLTTHAIDMETEKER